MRQGQSYSDSPSNHTQPQIHGSPTLAGEPSSLSTPAPLIEETSSSKRASNREIPPLSSITEQQPPRPSGSLVRTQSSMDTAASSIPQANTPTPLESSCKITAWVNHLATLFEAMSDGVTVYNHEGHVLYANTTARQIFMFTNWLESPLLSLAERSISLDLRDETGMPLALERWPLSRLLRGEKIPEPQAETVLLRTPDERELQLRLSGAPLYDAGDQIIGAVLISKALGERQLPKQQRPSARTETLLELLKRVIDELPCGVYIVQGEEARLVLANRAATEAWGAIWQPDQPLQEFFRSKGVELFQAEGNSLPLEEHVALQAVQQGGRIEPRHIFIRHPDGSMRLLLTHALALDPSVLGGFRKTIVPAAPSSETWAVVILQDITPLKEAEQLKHDIQVLKEAEQIKDNFIATAAHELRSPLTALMGYAEMLNQQAARNKGSELAEWQIEALETIAHDTMRIVGLTNDLLDVTRLQAGQLPLHRYNTNLVALAHRVVARLRDTTKQHTLIVESSAQRIATNLDVQRIEQVVTNLVNNALKYSPNGGNVLLRIQEDTKAGWAVLSVHDLGIGIPASQQEQIFHRFFRATNVIKLGLEGSGLGLYLSRELIQLHGGQVWFESVEGQGSTFFLSLPLVAGSAL